MQSFLHLPRHYTHTLTPTAVAGSDVLDALGGALARGVTRLGPDGFGRAATTLARLGGVPSSLLGEVPLKALMRGDGADRGAVAILEVLLGLASSSDGVGGKGCRAQQLPAQQADAVVRALLDALSRISPAMLAAVLAALPRLGLGAAGARLLAKLSGEYARRPVPAPDAALLLAVLRGVSDMVDAADEPSGGSGGGGGSSSKAGGGGSAAALRNSAAALLNRLWDDARPLLPAMADADLWAAAALLAQLGCLAPATPWKARAADAVAAEVRARLHPASLRADRVAALPSLVTALAAGQQPGSKELVAAVQAAFDRALRDAPAGRLWACFLGLAQLEPAQRAAVFSGDSGGGGAVALRVLEGAAPGLAHVVAAAAVAAEQRAGGADDAAESDMQAAEAAVGALDLDTLAFVVSTWAQQPGAPRSNSAALLAWLDLPGVVGAALGAWLPLVDNPDAAAVAAGAPPQLQQPMPLDAAAWRALAALLRGVVDATAHATQAARDSHAERLKQKRDTKNAAVGGDQTANDADGDSDNDDEDGRCLDDLEVAPPSSLIAGCLALFEAQGRPTAGAAAAGVAACAAPDAVSLLWSLSALGVLGLGHWDILAVALDQPGLEFTGRQLAEVFEAHALVLLRLHGVAPLPTPAGELQRCCAAYWTHQLVPAAAGRSAMARSLGAAGLLAAGVGITVQEQGHLLLLDCIDPGESVLCSVQSDRVILLRCSHTKHIHPHPSNIPQPPAPPGAWPRRAPWPSASRRAPPSAPTPGRRPTSPRPTCAAATRRRWRRGCAAWRRARRRRARPSWRRSSRRSARWWRRSRRRAPAAAWRSWRRWSTASRRRWRLARRPG